MSEIFGKLKYIPFARMRYLAEEFLDFKFSEAAAESSDWNASESLDVMPVSVVSLEETEAVVAVAVSSGRRNPCLEKNPGSTLK